MKYLYETHLHTSQSSACSLVRARDYVPRYIDAGYAGIVVTDHFFGGNTAIDRSLPWKEKVKAFVKGYEEAKEAGLQKGLSVFFGWEENYAGAEFLIYGLSPQWLMDHPEAEGWTIAQQFDQVSKAGGCVIQVHPFRDVRYISHIRLYPYLVHGVEGYNFANNLNSDTWGAAYANAFNLPMTAGTDIHRLDRWDEKNIMGIALDKPLENIGELVSLIKEKKAFSLKLTKDREDIQKREKQGFSIPVTTYDQFENPIVKPSFVVPAKQGAGWR